MSTNYEIAFGMLNDIPGIVALQDSNLPESGGSLSVREAADWFTHAVSKSRLSLPDATASLSAMC